MATIKDTSDATNLISLKVGTVGVQFRTVGLGSTVKKLLGFTRKTVNNTASYVAKKTA